MWVWSRGKLPSLGSWLEMLALSRLTPEEWQSLCIMKSLILFCDFRDRVKPRDAALYCSCI